MNRQDKIELLMLLEEKQKRRKYRLFESYFPDEGPLRRELYQKLSQRLLFQENHNEIFNNFVPFPVLSRPNQRPPGSLVETEFKERFKGRRT